MNDTRADVRDGVLDAAVTGLFAYLAVELMFILAVPVGIVLFAIVALGCFLVITYWPYLLGAAIAGFLLYMFLRELKWAWLQAHPPAPPKLSFRPRPRTLIEDGMVVPTKVQPYFAED